MGILGKITGFFTKKAKLKAIIFDEVGKQHEKKVEYANNYFSTSINGESHAYVVDHNFINYGAKNNEPIAHYYINNPQPIRLQHERNEEMDSIGFKKILESKVITDLFTEQAKNLLTLLMILMVITLIGVAIVGMKVFGVIK